MILAIFAVISSQALSGHQSGAAEKPIRKFYISPYGSDFNSGAKEAPFLTFKKADSVVQPCMSFQESTTDTQLKTR
jgi:hypothetical protein